MADLVASQRDLSDVVVGFIGAGRMAQAMCNGFLSSGLLKASQLIASDPDENMLGAVKKLGVRTLSDNQRLMKECHVVVLAVKPQAVNDVLIDISGVITPEHLLISIAAGINLNSLQSSLPSGTRIVRVMPNTPALVLCGASVFSRGSFASAQDAELVRKLFSTLGMCEEAAEKHLDAVTGLSGSGPAYMFMAVEALADGGVKMGLPRDLATKLAAQTMMGSAKMILETGKHPAELKDAVCSPAGTTISAVYELEKSAFRFALMNAVETATLCSIELGKL